VYQALVGWATEVLINKWRSGQEGWIARREFDRQLHTIILAIVRSKIMARAARVIPVTDDEKGEARTHRFLFHLSLIEMDEPELDEELIHYIRFNKEKLRLVDEGASVPKEWEFRGDRLCDYWKTTYNKISLLRSENEPTAKTGMRIFYEVAAHREPLAGDPMPDAYMTIGHFHRLANDDRVYWHPEFKKSETG
jgi:hypothetical protein